MLLILNSPSYMRIVTLLKIKVHILPCSVYIEAQILKSLRKTEDNTLFFPLPFVYHETSQDRCLEVCGVFGLYDLLATRVFTGMADCCSWSPNKALY